MEELQENKHMCKFCSKVFPSGRSLGGHMRSHLITITSSDHRKTSKKRLPSLVHGKTNAKDGLKENPEKIRKHSTSSVSLVQDQKLCKALFGHPEEKDSWNSCHRRTQNTEFESDNKEATSFCRRKRSEKGKRYCYSSTPNSSSLTCANFSPESVSEIDLLEQEEVALSLIILSQDKGGWDRINSLNNGEPLQSKKTKNAGVSHETGRNDFVVNSPRKLIIKGIEFIEFEESIKKNKARKRKSLGHVDSDRASKFTCSICDKSFHSYQALGGHRASHKKFQGLCSSNPSKAETKFECRKGKGYECPYCLKVFLSGQALGGHKRSHLITDPFGMYSSHEAREHVRDNRDAHDLNLPLAEEKCNEFKPWWINRHEKLIGLNFKIMI